MKKEELVTRLIHKKEIYYRVKDIAEMRNVSVAKLRKIIKEQNIETVTIEGFGRTRWIKEEYVNEIEIDGTVDYMRTEVKDFKKEYKLKSVANAMACAFLNKKEVDTSKIVKETVDSMNEFAKGITNERAEKNRRRVETFNQIFEELGVANRFHSFEFLVGNEIHEITVLVGIDGRIVSDENFAIDYIFDDETINELKAEIVECGGLYQDCDEFFRLDFGEPFESDSVHLINELLRNMSENEIKMFSNDWIDVRLDSGNYLGIKFDTFLDMLNEDIRVVA